MRYARDVKGRLQDVIDIPAGVADPAAWLANQMPTLTGFFRVADDAQSGWIVQNDGSYKGPDLPPAPPVIPKPISMTRFDAIFAAVIGEVAYDDILDALAAVAATSPKSADSVRVKRVLRAREQESEVHFPISPITDPAPEDLTASFLAVVVAALAGTVPDIEKKVAAGLLAWQAA